MKHIIDKLLLISKINLVADITNIIKRLFIISSAIMILPPSDKDWKQSVFCGFGPVYTNPNGYKFYRNSIGKGTECMNIIRGVTLSKEQRMLGVTYDLSYEIMTLRFKESNINCNNIWFDDKLFTYNHSSNIAPLYHFPN